jgi:hypothetical protein
MPNKLSVKRIVAVAALGALLGEAASAAPPIAQSTTSAESSRVKKAEPPQTLVRLARHVKLNMRFAQVHRARTGMDGADAVREYTIVNPALRVPYAKWGELDISVRYDVKHFGFGGASNLVSGSLTDGTPFNDLHNYAVRLGTNMRMSENSFWSMGLYSQARWETGANVDNATRWGGFAAVGVQVAPRLFIGLGGGFRNKLHRETYDFGPVWRIRWQATELIDLSLKNTLARVRLKLTKKVTLEFLSGYSGRVYQLKNRGDESASKVEESSIPVTFGLLIQQGKQLRYELTAGVLLDHKLQTNAGRSTQTIDQGAAVYLSFAVRLRN